MGISNVPLPSFTLVLTSDRVIIPGRSMVLRIEAPITVIQPVPKDLMNTVDLYNQQSENLLGSCENDSNGAHGTLSHGTAIEPTLLGVPEESKQVRTYGGVKPLIRFFKKGNVLKCFEMSVRRAELTTN